MQPFRLSTGATRALSWTSDAPGGFSRAQVAVLARLTAMLGPHLEARAAWETAEALLTSYLGHGPGAEVLQGAIRRGDVRRLRTVILMADMRGFTVKAASWPEPELLAALHSFYDLIVGATYAHGGDVLKFLGDGLLAIFPVVDDPADACRRAMVAAQASRQGLRQLNRERRRVGQAALDFVVALDLGEVAYGNIGGPSRLDFTIIGAPVNRVARLTALAKRLRRNLLLTEPAATALGGGTRSLGQQMLKGFERAEEVFEPADAGEPVLRPQPVPIKPLISSLTLAA